MRDDTVEASSRASTARAHPLLPDLQGVAQDARTKSSLVDLSLPIEDQMALLHSAIHQKCI